MKKLLVFGLLQLFGLSCLGQSPAELRERFFFEALKHPENIKEQVNGYAAFRTDASKHELYQIYQAANAYLNYADLAMDKWLRDFEKLPESKDSSYRAKQKRAYEKTGVNLMTMAVDSGEYGTAMPVLFVIITSFLEEHGNTLTPDHLNRLEATLFGIYLKFKELTYHQNNPQPFWSEINKKSLYAPDKKWKEIYAIFLLLLISDDFSSTALASLESDRFKTDETDALVYFFSYPKDDLTDKTGVKRNDIEKYCSFIYHVETEELDFIHLPLNKTEGQRIQESYYRAYGDPFANSASASVNYYDKLWKEMDKQLSGARNLIVFGHGIYGTMPLGALKATNGSYLSDKYSFFYRQDRDLQPQKNTSRKKRPSKTYLLLGNPTLNAKSTETNTVGSDSRFIRDLIQEARQETGDKKVTRGPENQSDLAGAQIEVQFVDSLLRYYNYVGLTKINQGASETEFYKSFDANIIHIAGHFNSSKTQLQQGGDILDAQYGRYQDAIPLSGSHYSIPDSLRSLLRQTELVSEKILNRVSEVYDSSTYVRLEEDKKLQALNAKKMAYMERYMRLVRASPAFGELRDSLLTIDEINRFELDNTQLVVLSGCGSGYQTVNNEQVYGFVDAFRSAGASSVLASLWLVDDVSTAILMEEFYAHWLSGKSKAESLREAQAFVRKIPGFENPYFWAGWILYGKG